MEQDKAQDTLLSADIGKRHTLVFFSFAFSAAISVAEYRLEKTLTQDGISQDVSVLR